ncbi:uncharacterized protein LOC103464676 [Poecilia reticulata]|uniref:uncharacterized protein LOC103464676 n=1 Tax=Poecilia reticulata TaxID=8081 RepID=UPI0004A32312|nr:PREDICTED: uncharacterized protein LOC103464676 [Poecilia reticulata]
MKTLWVAVVLSFVSVGQPAPLTCDKLAKPVEKRPDLSGRWHYIAVSTEVCLPALLINNIFWPSIAVDITHKGTPNLYAATVKGKMYGFCINETEDFFQETNKLFEVNSENAPVGEPDVVLQTSCSDCIVLKSNDTLSTVSLLSRRTTITEEELKEFEMQVQCVRFSKPQVLNADQDYDSCQDIDDITEDQSRTFLLQVIERVRSSHQSILKCFVDMLLSYIPVTIT